jgi:hypothetical protein
MSTETWEVALSTIKTKQVETTNNTPLTQLFKCTRVVITAHRPQSEYYASPDQAIHDRARPTY